VWRSVAPLRATDASSGYLIGEDYETAQRLEEYQMDVFN
jgi:hypothetical protein